MSGAWYTYGVKKLLEGGAVMPTENDFDSTCGLTDDELTARFNESIRIEAEISRAKGVPVVRYDGKKRQVYFEYADGRTQYAEKA
jgi:hypothetical protein